MRGKATIFIDGAARNNPGPAAIGAVILQGKKKLAEISRYIGETTNNVAEYTACIEGLKKAHALRVTEVAVYSDSELLVRQINGEYRVKDARLQTLMSQLRVEQEKFAKFSIQHIPREQNTRADALANQALDELQ